MAELVDLRNYDTLVEFTLSLDTSAYAAGDVLADTQELASVARQEGGTAILASLVLNDKDDQGVALDLVFLQTNVSLGTENAAPSISDANGDKVLGIIPVTADKWIDLGGCRSATLLPSELGLIVKAASGATSIYIAAITRGAPTHTASGITGKFGFLRPY